MRNKTKAELYDEMLDLGVQPAVAKALCDWMDSSELAEFVEFLSAEL